MTFEEANKLTDAALVEFERLATEIKSLAHDLIESLYSSDLADNDAAALSVKFLIGCSAIQKQLEGK